MTFYDIYQSQYLQFSKAQGKKFKKLSREDRAAKFLEQAGPGLQKQLLKAVDKGEKIDFRLLPKTAKNYFGKKTVVKRKRRNIWKKAELIRLSGQNYKFNEQNAVKGFLMPLINKSSGPGFFVDFIKTGNESETKEAILTAIDQDAEKARNDTDVFNKFNEIATANDSDAYWEVWGLFNERDDYLIFINLI